jgi:hypothetical protein
LKDHSKVWPSGAARAAAAAAMIPPAWGRLSTTTGWPSRNRSFSATRRAGMSIELPAAAETIRRIGRSGYCALTVSASAQPRMNVER